MLENIILNARKNYEIISKIIKKLYITILNLKS